MTDEMKIQQQASSTPYLLGGLAVGATGGYGLSRIDSIKNWVSDPATLERLKEIGEKPDTVELSTKQKASLEGLKSKLAELKAAEAELEAASKAVPVDAELTNKFNSARDAYELHLQKLQETEARRLKNSGGRAVTTPVAFNELAITGNATQRTSLENEYNNLRRAYEAANTRVEASINSGVGATRTARVNQIETYLNNEFAQYGRMTEEQITEAFNKKTELQGFLWKNEVPTAQYQRALNQASVHYPDFTRANLKGEHYLQFGQQIERGATVPAGYQATNITITDPVTHRPKRVGVMYKEADLLNFVKTESERVAEQRIAYADELFNNARESVLLRQKQTNLASEFASNVEKGLANSTGLYTAPTANTAEVFNFAQMQQEAGRSINPVTNRRNVQLIGYDADIKSLSDSLKAARNGGTAQMPAQLNGAYATNDVQKALEMARARKSVMDSYAREARTLAREIEQCTTANSVIANLDSQIATLRASDAGLEKARARFVEKFPEVFGNAEAATLSEAEILSKAQAYAESHADAGIKQRFEQAKVAYDKAVAEGATKIDDAAKAAAEGKVTKFKGELEKMGKEFCSTSKGKLALVIGGTAVAGALLAMALKPKNN